MELTDLIKVYDDVLTKTECDQLIRMFDTQDGMIPRKYFNDGTLKFTESRIRPGDFTDNLLLKIREYQNEYCLDIDNKLNCRVFPNKTTFERLKIKRYIPKLKEQFGTHVDASNKETCNRFLSMLIYLNDVEQGGQTQFNDVTIEPKVGRMIIFPPLWMYPHAGTPPVSNPKYILGTYLRFV